MPKVRRKRQTTSKKTNPLSRPKKIQAKLESAENNEPIKATYFDLVAQPNASIKSKSADTFVQISKPPRNLKVPDHWNVKSGDVISWSEGRPTETFFVTADGKLLKNPDKSGSGYLTIPISITSQFSDALDHFSSVLDSIGREYVSSIELSPNDLFFSKNFSNQSLPESIRKRDDILYSFDPNDNVLHVTIESKSDQSQQFPLDSTKIDDIIEWISTANEMKAKITISYDFEGDEMCSKAPRGVVTGLPVGWKCEQQGSAIFGSTKIQGEWKCEGPAKTKDKARKMIDKHYKGLKVEIK